MRLSFIIGLLLFSMAACQQEEQQPDYLWSEEKFVEVLTDVQMAEAIVRLGYNRLPDSLYLNDSIYSSAFDLNEVTKAEFDSNLNYYLDQPEQLEKMYDQVIVNLSTRLAEEKAMQPKLQKGKLP